MILLAGYFANCPCQGKLLKDTWEHRVWLTFFNCRWMHKIIQKKKVEQVNTNKVLRNPKNLYLHFKIFKLSTKLQKSFKITTPCAHIYQDSWNIRIQYNLKWEVNSSMLLAYTGLHRFVRDLEQVKHYFLILQEDYSATPTWLFPPTQFLPFISKILFLFRSYNQHLHLSI